MASLLERQRTSALLFALTVKRTRAALRSITGHGVIAAARSAVSLARSSKKTRPGQRARRRSKIRENQSHLLAAMGSERTATGNDEPSAILGATAETAERG